MSDKTSVSAPAMDVVIGLEVHAQLATESKIFCACPTKFGEAPNSQICPVCTGLPGTLPVFNRRAFELALRAVIALGGTVTRRVKFDRKNYFYPDLPKNYQISQYDLPVGKGGYVEIATPKGLKKIPLIRLHLEEDAGKLIHEPAKGVSLVDFNRSGVPLLEIVSTPEITSPDEAYSYLVNLKAILRSIGVSEADMEKGHLRCDTNISLRKTAKDPFGPKVEIKNLNSFKFVRAALQYEIQRQTEMILSGSPLVQETRLWDAGSQKTAAMRTKEEAHDYRYFPEPDLVPFEIDQRLIDATARAMPELPKEKKERFKAKFHLSDYDTDLLLQDDDSTQLFEALAQRYTNFKNLANWIIGPFFAYLNECDRGAGERGAAFQNGFIELLEVVDEGAVSLRTCKEIVFPEFMRTGKSPRGIIKERQLSQISDESLLDEVIAKVIRQNEKTAKDYRSGKETALGFLVGQVMKETKGKANPHMVNQMIRERLAK